MASCLYGATLMGGKLGPTLQCFDESVRTMHAVLDAKVVFGYTDIDCGTSPLAGLVSWLFGFPAPGRALPTAITVVSDGACEIWHRRFANQPILTRLEPGRSAQPTIVERFRFGVAFDLRVLERDGRLRFEVVGMRIFGIPMPQWLWPTLTAEECEESGGFRFDIDIGMRWTGRLIRYHGWVRAGG
ncbi:MAG TPA: DUF4166 domain-containing protein [Burkholderiales bacterium]